MQAHSTPPDCTLPLPYSSLPSPRPESVRPDAVPPLFSGQFRALGYAVIDAVSSVAASAPKRFNNPQQAHPLVACSCACSQAKKRTQTITVTPTDSSGAAATGDRSIAVLFLSAWRAVGKRWGLGTWVRAPLCL